MVWRPSQARVGSLRKLGCGAGWNHEDDPTSFFEPRPRGRSSRMRGSSRAGNAPGAREMPAPIFFQLSCLKKKSRATALLGKLCRPYFPECLDLSLIDGATPLVRARAPPETWTTRRKPHGRSEPQLVADLFALVTIFGNECSNFRQLAKRLKFRHSRLCCRHVASRVSSLARQCGRLV